MSMIGQSGDFKGAGLTEGLTIWRIEKLTPKLVPKETYGQFMDGDSYIILFSKKKSGGNLAHDIHFWLGSGTSFDEQGAAAIKSIELDDFLGGSPVQHREVQGSETDLFLSYFKLIGGVRYLSGGIESGFNHVKPTEYKAKLFQVKGKRNVRVIEIPAKTSNMNDGDVYIYDAGTTLYIYNGRSSSQGEKTKAVQTVQQIKNERSKIKMAIVTVSDDADSAPFWAALGPKSDIKSAEAGGSDDEFEKKSAPKLICVADGSEIKPEDGKLKKDMLNSEHIYIIDNTNNVYVWVGKGADADVKKQAMFEGIKYLKDTGKPNSTPIERVLEKAESTAFTNIFSGWKAEASHLPTSPTSAGIATRKSTAPVDVKAVLKKQAESEKLLDDGSGKASVWRIENMDRAEVPEDMFGQFYGGDSYIIQYTYKVNGKDNNIIYFWQGRESSKDEIGMSALLATKLRDTLPGQTPTCRVVQGKEPQHFCLIFKGKLCIHSGGHASGFKNRNEADHFTADEITLYHVKGTNPNNTKAVQVNALTSSLSSGDCFILRTPSTAFLWEGEHSSPEEKNTAAAVANTLLGKRTLVKLAEGSESNEFWTALGGKGEYNKSIHTESPIPDPRLFQCSNAKSGFRVDEITNFCQEDLCDDDVMLLDAYNSLYLWIGSGSNKEEQLAAVEFANKYVLEADDGRDNDCTIMRVCAGFEPIMFTQHFVGWNPALGCSSDEAYARKLRELGSAFGDTSVRKASTDDFKFKTGVIHPLKALKGKGNVPEGVDATQKENYLSDEEFKTVFGMDKEAFHKQPAWKVKQMKQAKDLF